MPEIDMVLLNKIAKEAIERLEDAKCNSKEYYYSKNKKLFLGLFDNKIDAALAYDNKAKELLGDKAKVNFEEPISWQVITC